MLPLAGQDVARAAEKPEATPAAEAQPSALDAPAPVEIPPAPQLVPPAQPDNPHELSSKMPEGVDIRIDGALTPMDGSMKNFKVGGPIRLKTNRGEEVYANHATLDLEKKIYTLYGDISVYLGPLLQRGDRVVYDLATGTLDTSKLSASYDPVLLESGTFSGQKDADGNTIYTSYDSGITTHDVEKPNYWLRAGRTRFFPGEKIVFNDLRVIVGDTQVFWLPYLSQPLNSELGYRFVPGGRTNWGFFMLNSYGIMLGDTNTPGATDPWLLSKWHVDVRSSRGIGMGVDLFDTRVEQKENFGWLKFYFTHDLDPSLGRSGIPRGPVDPTRYRTQFQYRMPLSFSDSNPNAEYHLNYDLHLLSDNHLLEDFDPQFYRDDAQPDNTIFLTRRTDTSLFTGLARLRLNDFYRSDSRSPELSFDQIRRPIFGSSIYHEGSISAGIYAENMSDPTRDTALTPLLTLPENNPNYFRLLQQTGRYEQLLIREIRSLPPLDPRRDALLQQLTEPEFTRFHTYQEFSTQMTLHDWLHITPRIGAGYSRYDNVAGPALNDQRTTFAAGLEASFKLKKDYSNVTNWVLGIDGIRHTLQPYTAWSLVSTSNLGADFPMIDRQTFSTRPVPINPGRFTAIDGLQSWNLARIGVRNRLITRRDSGSHEWLLMDTYMDAYVEDPEFNRQFSNLYNDVTWSPLPWLAIDLQTQFPIINSGSGYNEFTTAARFMPTEDFEFSVAQNTLSNHPFLRNSNRLHLTAYKRMNDNWGVGMLHQWEFDDATLELEQYTFHRNYENWIVSAGLTRRDNRLRTEYGVMLNFTLKDFPSVSLPFRIDAQ
jgi:LPS-assembly protein